MIKIFTFLIFFASFQTYSKTIIISDANETLLRPYSLFSSLKTYEDTVDMLKKARAELKDEEDLSIHIVSNTLDFLYSGGLKKALFNLGVPLNNHSLVINQSNFQEVINIRKPKEKLKRKVIAIKYILDLEIEKLKENEVKDGPLKLILLGDNSELDPQAYVQVIKEIKKEQSVKDFDFSFNIYIYDFAECYKNKTENCFFNDKKIPIQYFKNAKDLKTQDFFSP